MFMIDIQYLQKLKDNKKIGLQTIEGLSEQKILEYLKVFLGNKKM